MQTIQPLSQEEALILRKTYRDKIFYVNAAQVIGLICTLTGIFLLWLNSLTPVADDFLLVVIIGLLITGPLVLLVGTYIRNRHKRRFKTTLEINQKEVIRGDLKKVEIINRNTLRYHFTGFSKDVKLNIYLWDKTFLIQSFEMLSHVNVSLHIVSLASGDHLLLKAMYDQPVCSGEQVIPFTAEDKKRLSPHVRKDFGIVLLIALIISTVVSIPVFFNPRMIALLLPYTIGIPMLITLVIFLYGMIIIKISTHSIVFTTRIAERICVRVKQGKYSTEQTWYRLDNGAIEFFGRSDLRIGSIVRFSFLQKKNGTRGMLMEVEKK